MRRNAAEAVVAKLNRDYRGPSDNMSAFCAKRSCATDGDGYWDYYISTPFGVYSRDTGVEISMSDQRRLIDDACRDFCLTPADAAAIIGASERRVA